MLRTHWKTAAFAVAGLGLMTPVQGDQITDMQAQIDGLRAELSQVQTDQGDNWLNERRAEEVKGLIMEVLSDADMRASLAGDGATSGYGEEGFFIMSPDGAFSLYISGQLQFQYIYNNQDKSGPGVDEDEGGFQTNRAKINFDGHISSPKVGFHIVLAHHRATGQTFLEEYNVSHQVNDNIQVAAGLIKLPFLREELIESTHTLAVERSLANEFFTVGRGEGVRLRYDDGPLLINFMLSDGANSDHTDFEDDSSELALTGRIDYLVEGIRSQLEDFTGWSGEGQALNIGGAYHIQYGDGRNGGTDNYHAHTIDAQWENGPLNAFVAYTGASISPDSGTVDNRNMDSFVVQGGVHIVPDKLEAFGRWLTLDGDVAGEDTFNAWLVGVNYYINGHQTKLTTDVIFLGDMVPTDNPFGSGLTDSGLGLITGEEDNFAIRTQLQVTF